MENQFLLPFPSSEETSLSNESGVPLPPERTYSTREELNQSLQSWARRHFHAFRIQRSSKIHNSSRVRLLYSCDRAGNPPADTDLTRSNARKRKMMTRKTDCQFSVIASEHADGRWVLRHRSNPIHSFHNHPPSNSAMSHPAHRRPNDTAIREAKSLYDAGKYRTTTQ